MKFVTAKWMTLHAPIGTIFAEVDSDTKPGLYIKTENNDVAQRSFTGDDSPFCDWRYGSLVEPVKPDEKWYCKEDGVEVVPADEFTLCVGGRWAQYPPADSAFLVWEEKDLLTLTRFALGLAGKSQHEKLAVVGNLLGEDMS